MRLIDADALMHECDSLINVNATPNRYIDLIENAPTVEYTFEEAFQKTVCDNKLYCPNKRPKGGWIKDYTHEEHGETSIVCSICSYSVPNKSNFCPNCGADMRGDVK